MFNGASAFNGDISGWNTISVTDMNQMFRDAVAFNGDLSDWNVIKAQLPLQIPCFVVHSIVI